MCPVSRHQFIVIKGLPLKDYSAVIVPKNLLFERNKEYIFVGGMALR
jgi:hypothetical protein